MHNTFDEKHLLVFAADNGVVAEGVASEPQSVTLHQTVNLTRTKNEGLRYSFRTGIWADKTEKTTEHT